jgi:hypothetical protein
VCPASPETLSLSLTCVDKSPLSQTASLKYTAVAVYRAANGELAQGPAEALTIAGGPPPAANPPTNLTLTKNVDGSVTLRWLAPTSGPAVAFYRIYRESTNYTSRYGVTGSGTTVEFTDSDANIVHSYWVTAATSNFSESSFLGPVSG